MKKVGYILVDRNDNYVACCSQPADADHSLFIREEDGLIYQAETAIRNSIGETIATIYREKVEICDEALSLEQE